MSAVSFFKHLSLVYELLFPSVALSVEFYLLYLKKDKNSGESTLHQAEFKMKFRVRVREIPFAKYKLSFLKITQVFFVFQTAKETFFFICKKICPKSKMHVLSISKKKAESQKM